MESKRVCIVTNYSSTSNYGALLQAYALNRVINDMGYPAEDLYFVRNASSKRKDLLYRLCHGECKSVLNQIKSRIEKIRVRRQLRSRKAILDDFRFSISHTIKYSNDDIDTVSGKYDVFICGSDQIFRPNKNTGELESYYWLTMVGDPCIKASYAASLGIENYDRETELLACKYLSNFDFISIREKTATDYIKRITGREDVITSVDPVFLIKREEWLRLVSPYEVGEKYILVYMIHGTKDLYKSIREFAVTTKMIIVTFPSMSYRYKDYEKDFGDIMISDASPEQFLFLISNASYFFTDSFHGTAFSLILHKKVFISKANEIAFSRINNIVSLFGVENFIIPSEGLTTDEYLKQSSPDWKELDKIMEEERKKSYEYLRMVIEG